MATDTAVLLKQYRDLVRNIESFTDGQAHLKESDDTGDSLDEIYITFTIKNGPYRGGTFDFLLDVTDNFPVDPPTVTCLTDIYHPNIDWSDEQGDVCLNLFDELWTSESTLEDVVQGILFLLYNPNIEDPLNYMFQGDEDQAEFLADVRRSLRGESVNDLNFSRNLPDGYESDPEGDDYVIPKASDDEDCDEETDTESESGSLADLESEVTTESASNNSETNKPEVTPEQHIRTNQQNPGIVAATSMPQLAHSIAAGGVGMIVSSVSLFAYKRLESFVGKLFTKYVQGQRTVIESSVDAPTVR